MAKRNVLHIRLDDRHMRILEALAKAVGIPISDVVRQLIDNSTVLHVPVAMSHVEAMEKEGQG